MDQFFILFLGLVKIYTIILIQSIKLTCIFRMRDSLIYMRIKFMGSYANMLKKKKRIKFMDKLHISHSNYHIINNVLLNF